MAQNTDRNNNSELRHRIRPGMSVQQVMRKLARPVALRAVLDTIASTVPHLSLVDLVP